MSNSSPKKEVEDQRHYDGRANFKADDEIEALLILNDLTSQEGKFVGTFRFIHVVYS